MSGGWTGHRAQDRFVASLLAILDPGKATLSALHAEFLDAMLAFGSATPDNRAAAERLGIAEAPAPYGKDLWKRAVTLRNHDINIAEVLNLAEDASIPENVQAEFPQLEQEDWAAVLRIATLVFSAFEREIAPS